MSEVGNRIVTGNILDTGAPAIIGHQVNCRGAFGAGLAGQIAHKWPKAKDHYHVALIDLDGPKALGHAVLSFVEPHLAVAHLFGQDLPGKHTDYTALGLAMEHLANVAQDFNLPVYLPYGIGCGIGGGKWNTVAPMIAAKLPNATIVRLPKEIR